MVKFVFFVVEDFFFEMKSFYEHMLKRDLSTLTVKTDFAIRGHSNNT